MIEAHVERSVRTSQETIWRHLTRISDWPRWYPGLHGVDAASLITGTDTEWRSSGQMGRLLYRAAHRVAYYQTLDHIEVVGPRRPWFRCFRLKISVGRDGANARLDVEISATPYLGAVGRILLGTLLRRFVDREANDVAERLARYAEHTLPHQ